MLGTLSQFVCGLLILLAWFVEDVNTAVAIISLGSFVFAFGGCCAFAVVIDVARPHVATVTSTMIMAGNIGAASCPAVVGWLVESFGWRPILLFFAAIYFCCCLLALAQSERQHVCRRDVVINLT